MRLKMSFKLQLFATVNPFMILAAIKKTFENYGWVEAPLCLLCQGEINHSVPGGTPAGIWTDCAIWPRVEIDYASFSSFLSFNLQINSLCLREISVQRKQTNDGFAQLGHAQICLFIHRWMFYTDWDEIWQRRRISQTKGTKNKVHNLSITEVMEI